MYFFYKLDDSLFARGMTCLSLILAVSGWYRISSAQEVEVWEFAPYQVEIWYAFDASLDLSTTARNTYVQQLEQELARAFRAAWRLQSSELAPDWTSAVQEHFGEFQLDDLRQNELVSVVSLESDETRSVRTVDAAVERLSQIAISSEDLELLKRTAKRLSVPEDSSAAKFLDLCTVVEAGGSRIQEGLRSGEIAAAVLPRSELKEVNEQVRVLITSLPWQMETILRERDKIFFLSIERRGDAFVSRVRELDCPMQFLGPAFQVETTSWPHASRLTADAIIRAFAPIARVEQAESTTAELRQRAAGLIVDPGNPANIRVGDVLQPIVRRDDRNGVPTLLQPLSWTYAAITEKSQDGVKLDANVYTYSGGPGLRGRQNRRTQKVLLRVRPQVDATDLRILVRDSQQAQSGCFVYRRDLLTDEFELLGRTDWRGQFKLPVPQNNGKFLPDAIRRKRLIAKREALQRAAAQALSRTDEGGEEASPEVESPETGETPKSEAGNESSPTELAAEIDEDLAGRNYDPDKDRQALPLNFPLMEIYLKNGNTVLAKLPIVPGLQEIETAELPDDTRRLQAEAFVKGFQGEILDLVGLRNLLAARISIYLKEGEVARAGEALEQMRRLPTYNELSDRLEQIQQKMLDEQDGRIPLVAKSRIDRMFQTTRDMLQKFLQDNLLQNAESSVKRALDAGGNTGV